ncbi:MAG: hypothetical protein ACR2MM_05790, partial [Flavobacteriaceae bacterium]
MENQSPEHNNKAEEVDLGQLFPIIGQGFGSLFRVFLRSFVYLKRKAILLGALIVGGFLLGLGINQFVDQKLKTEVIVKPNLESKTYLYDVVAEISTNLKSRDTVFFKGLNIEPRNTVGFGIDIEPLKEEQADDITNEIKYLELLEKFRDEEGVLEVVRNEILAKSTLNHRITFTYRYSEGGRATAKALMNYINSNEYYDELISLRNQNAKERIASNDTSLKQIDELIAGYSSELQRENISGGSIVLSDAEPLNVAGLLNIKKALIKDSEQRRLEIQDNKEAIRIISFGNTQNARESIFKRPTILIPILLIVLY